MIPLFLIFFGIGDAAKVAAGAFAAILILSLNTMYGVLRGNLTRRLVARTLRLSPARTFVLVILPDALPDIFVGLRLAVSACLVLVVVSEMFVGTTLGMGRRIYDAQLLYKLEDMYTGILVLGVLGYFLNRIIVRLEARLAHWSSQR